MHEGHRKRMYEKLKNDDSLFDHEVLEILLFNAFQRTNTNPIAHSLLSAFGSIAGVLSASYEELIAVDGVGENVALYLKCVGECYRRAGGNFDADNSMGVTTLKSYEDFKRFVALRCRGKAVETLEIYALEKNGKMKNLTTRTNNERDRVVIGTEEVSRVLTNVRPYGVLIAHNHLSGNAQPSESDDIFTGKVKILCDINNVNLYDHCIYAEGGEIYSYFGSGRIDLIKKNYTYEKLMDNTYKSMKENAD